MKWSTDIPTEPGWYWRKLRYSKGDESEPRILRVFKRPSMDGLYIEDGSQGCAYASVQDNWGSIITIWAGPISLPEEIEREEGERQ